MEPRVNFLTVGIDRLTFSPGDAVYRKGLFVFPTLNCADIALEVLGDFLPGVELVVALAHGCLASEPLDKVPNARDVFRRLPPLANEYSNLVNTPQIATPRQLAHSRVGCITPAPVRDGCGV